MSNTQSASYGMYRLPSYARRTAMYTRRTVGTDIQAELRKLTERSHVVNSIEIPVKIAASAKTPRTVIGPVGTSTVGQYKPSSHLIGGAQAKTKLNTKKSGSSARVFQDVRSTQSPQPQVVSRQNVAPPFTHDVAIEAPTQYSRSRFVSLFSRGNALTAMAIMVFVVGVGVSIQTFRTNSHAVQQVQAMQNSSQNDGDSISAGGDVQPDEQDVPRDSVGSYIVAPELPRKITISKINVSARVKALGVSSKNQLMAPSNIYDAGWYNASAKPGVDAGAVLIDGHVHGPTKPGVFANLKKLTTGDIIQVERGDGKVLTYKVEKSQRVKADQVDMAALMTSVKPGRQGLNLITCGGQYDKGAGGYQDRDMVFAVQVE